jgi:hypothetical protein
VVLSRLNVLKPATLEELFMTIFLWVLLDGYREHFTQCSLRTAEGLTAMADALWEMRCGNVAAMGHTPSPGRGGGHLAVSSGAIEATAEAATGLVAAVVAVEATMAAKTDSQHLGESASTGAAAPPPISTCTLAPKREQGSVPTITPLATLPHAIQYTSPYASS